MNWKKVKFIDAFSDVTGGNQKFKTNDYLAVGKIPVVDQGKELIAGYINDFPAFNDVPVVVFGDHTRILKYIDFPFVLGADGVKILKTKSGVDTKYAYYALQKIYIPNTGYNRHFKWVKESEIPLPDLTTQQHIAKVLDQADALCLQNRQLLAHYDELLQSTFIDLFGDPVKNEKGWEVKKLGEVCDKITDGTHQSPKFTKKGIPFLFVSNIINNKIDYNAPRFISEEDFNILNKRTPIEIGSILYTIVGSYGNPAIIKETKKFAFQRHIAFMKPNHEIINYTFLHGQLQSDFIKNQVEKRVKGIAQKTLNLSELKEIDVLLPPLLLQQQFAQIVEQIEEQKAVVKQSLVESEVLFEGLLAEYFG